MSHPGAQTHTINCEYSLISGKIKDLASHIRRVSSDGSAFDFGLKGLKFEPRWILRDLSKLKPYCPLQHVVINFHKDISCTWHVYNACTGYLVPELSYIDIVRLKPPPKNFNYSVLLLIAIRWIRASSRSLEPLPWLVSRTSKQLTSLVDVRNNI